MINPYLIIVLLLAWLGSLVGVGYWQHHAGITETTLAYSQRDNNNLSVANSKIKSLEEAYRLAEQVHAANINLISTQYQKELDNANIKTADLVRGARAGTFRLRDPGAKDNDSCGNRAAQTTASTGERDGETRGELSKPFAEFLIAESGRADEIVNQLTACQQVVIEDRAH
jgi:prophage endopeptidase